MLWKYQVELSSLSTRSERQTSETEVTGLSSAASQNIGSLFFKEEKEN